MIPFLSHVLFFTDIFDGFLISISCLATFPNQDYINIHVYFLQILLWFQVLHLYSESMWNLFWSMTYRMVLILVIPNVSGNLSFLAPSHLDTLLSELMLQFPAFHHRSESGQTPLSLSPVVKCCLVTEALHLDVPALVSES